ncbi:MAG: hypothetical protein JSU96_17510 [Acidobacteriota bacterium]|nr:MAG: hypothetical protein JSU96_17510 [Acidobacteriota bacterium]
MAREDVFNTARNYGTFLGIFFKQVAKEVGQARALELYGQCGTDLGAMRARLIQENPGNPQAIAGKLKVLYESFGLSPEVTTFDGRIQTTFRECPIYEGLQTAGLERSTIEDMCKALTEQEGQAVRQQCPNSDLRLTRLRSSARDSCSEEIVLST